MNKEHIFPEWLIRRTSTNKTGIKWVSGKYIPASAATLPICVECNKTFGKELENPMRQIFDDLESDKGISDFDADLIIRWLWKISGLAWIANHPNKRYTRSYTLRERILNPIDHIRGKLTLAIALIDHIDESYGDSPMGVDSKTHVDAIFVSGVFSRIAFMVSLSCFEHLIPEQFSLYKLLPQSNESSSAKLFYPNIGFESCVDAVGVTKFSSIPLANAHDDHGLFLHKLYGSNN